MTRQRSSRSSHHRLGRQQGIGYKSSAPFHEQTNETKRLHTFPLSPSRHVWLRWGIGRRERTFQGGARTRLGLVLVLPFRTFIHDTPSGTSWTWGFFRRWFRRVWLIWLGDVIVRS